MARPVWHSAITIAVVLAAMGCGGDVAPVDASMNADTGTPTPDAAADVRPDAPTGLAILGRGTHARTAVRVTVIATNDNGLNNPRDLAFNPEAPEQLWVVNNTNNSALIIRNPGTPTQDVSRRAGPSSEHFLPRPSALAFGAPGMLATAHEEDQVTQPSTPRDFMGPTLWTSDYDIFDGAGPSHLDMLHNSPNSTGIAWARDNVYWVFDGAHRALVRYDFHMPHELGGSPHQDGEVARFVEGQVGYVPDVSSHLEVDRMTGTLYVADTGNSRIGTLDTSTGMRTTNISPNYDGSRQYRMAGAEVRTLIDGAAMGMRRPSGLALHDGMIFVSDNESSKIYAFRLDGTLVDYLDLMGEVATGGLMGFDFNAAGEIFIVDTVGQRILRISPAS